MNIWQSHFKVKKTISNGAPIWRCVCMHFTRRWHGDVACFIIDVQSKENLKNDIIEWLKLTVSSWCGAIDKNEIIDGKFVRPFELKAVPLTITMVSTVVKQSDETTQKKTIEKKIHFHLKHWKHWDGIFVLNSPFFWEYFCIFLVELKRHWLLVFR